MARIAVFGAAGRIGSRIVSEALTRGHDVTAVVRDPNTVSGMEPGTRVVAGNVLDPDSVKAIASEHDVVVSAVGGAGGQENLATIAPAARSLIAGLRSAGAEAPRLVTVGGAGSLRTPGGGQVWDRPGIPEDVLQTMHAHGDALEFYRTVDDLDWTSISPAAKIQPGRRTGTYRTANDDLITDESGNSTISFEDYAVAVIDEIEWPKHRRQRFTVAY
ncbi:MULTISPECIES: NAD(P)-dependent oxidoreductase [Arthrobacter]|uniref:NAD-dependent epimerase/dehydratase family protein n=1 Tax=Arthrobacter terricola TaxID=2547396 RepID=A0A4R5K9J9_9MICC|nr:MULTISPECIES: NAD(P)H-binding protein [Arthrobacter]MBT8163165.1 NAD(P)H-binding protein [Arthrobacter sp. GN70]TDF91265.1 NAD-dependent epimerase/dehydratase family protein [Arthrobacter terricola]